MNEFEKCAGYQLINQKLKSHEALDNQKEIEKETIIMSINNLKSLQSYNEEFIKPLKH